MLQEILHINILLTVTETFIFSESTCIHQIDNWSDGAGV